MIMLARGLDWEQSALSGRSGKPFAILKSDRSLLSHCGVVSLAGWFLQQDQPSVRSDFGLATSSPSRLLSRHRIVALSAGQGPGQHWRPELPAEVNII